MARNFINRLFQSSAQSSSLQQPPQAASASSTPSPSPPPPFQAMDIGIEEVEKPIWLTSIFRRGTTSYHYRVTFEGRTEAPDGRSHTYDKYTGYIRVPEDRINARLQDLFHRQGVVSISKTDDSRGRASLGKLVDIERVGNIDCYVRELEVAHGPNSKRYDGWCYIPCNEETPTRWRYEEAKAAQSIEAVPEEAEPKRTVVFRGVPRQGQRIKTEVWQLDGQDFHTGNADVHSLERRMDGEVERNYLTIYAPVAPQQYLWLQGDYPENGSRRAGKFVEIEDPEAEEDEKDEVDEE